MTHARIFVLVLTLAITGRAASFGAALSPRGQHRSSRTEFTFSIPKPVMFREVSGRGLLVRTWVNGTGPYTFAIDTGAGATLLSPRVAGEARVRIGSGRSTSIAGLSGISTSAQPAAVDSVAVGDVENYLPAKGLVMITNGLPRDLDGVLDPTEAFAPLGYVIDIPRREVSAFDPHALPLRIDTQPAEGATVQWLRESRGRRPFVQLDNGERALLDTGSSLGLAIRDSNSIDREESDYVVHDVGGGRVSTRRARPTTVAIGSLTLRNIPTDLVSGAEAGAPVLLGLNALRPFRLRFDPIHHLIEISSETNPRR